MTLLDACGVVAGYGETEILHGVSITVGMGEVVTIIGPNGCGKSTLMKAIVGLIRMRSAASCSGARTYLGFNRIRRCALACPMSPKPATSFLH